MKRRLLDDWLSAYIDYNDNSEAPLSYHMWSGLSIISGVLQRKVHMYWHPNTIYPNNYIILVGPSGRSRKGDAITSAKRFLKSVNVRLIGDDNSPEAIMKGMGDQANQLIYTDPTTNNRIIHSSVSCLSEELVVFTGQKNSRMLAYLTNWYDSQDDWDRSTKHQGNDDIIGMCFNLLAATAPDWLTSILTQESIGGGFTSRCIFVCEPGKRKTVTNPNLNMPNPRDREKLINDLTIIGEIIGSYLFSNEALEYYETWYRGCDKLVERNGITIGQEFSGYWSRRQTHVKKISMALSASHSSARVIELDDLLRAIKMMETAEKNMSKVFGGVTNIH